MVLVTDLLTCTELLELLVPATTRMALKSSFPKVKTSPPADYHRVSVPV